MFFLLFQHVAFAQGIAKGQVINDFGYPIIGANVMIDGTTNGTVTGNDGTFQLDNVPLNSIIRISFLSYQEYAVTFTGQSEFRIVLQEESHLYDEAIAIGYGTMKKSDLTGSITAIGEKNFNKGVFTSPVELIGGKIAGMQIISNGGYAGSGGRIRIRGGASLSVFNDPLIVLDGVPLDKGGITGSADVLSTINPNDVESMNVLKDASATAIYGSRASNGVIIITTKKGQKDGKIQVNFSTQNAIATVARKADVMNASTFREVVATNPFTSQKYIDYQGEASTNWQKEIYRSAFTTDNNVSVSGSLEEFLPFRFSAGYIRNDGTLKTDNMERGSAALNLSPTFFDNHLSVQINLKGMYSESRFGNDDAIGAAIRFDPTQPVKADGFDAFNGYYTWLNGHSQPLNSFATNNPVALLHSKIDKGTVARSIGNAQLDYKFHFLPELHANMNVGYDVSNGKGKNNYLPWGPNRYTQGGERWKREQDKMNQLLEFYLNYSNTIFDHSRLEVMGGYTYQNRKTTNHNYNVTNYEGDYTVSEPTYPQSVYQNTLNSFYGRLNLNMMEKYLLTATIRRDGSSRLNPSNRWGTFPSVALAWKINEEDFMQDFTLLSNLKLRLSYGLTGRQEIDVYEYLTQYAFEDPFYPGWRPSGNDQNWKWEETASTNIGLDFGLFYSRLSGSIDLYHKNTKNLLNTSALPMGSYFTNAIASNIGSMINNGYEVSLNMIAIDQKDLQWELGLTIAHNYSKITKLNLNPDYVGIATGDVSGGSGNQIQMHSVGHAPHTFYLYKQLYYNDGTPIDGAFADLNGDNVINEKDKYFVRKPDPDVILGFNTSFTWQQWTASTSLRASIGNYVYNNTYSDLGSYAQVFNPNDFLMNTVHDIRNTQFYNQNLLSDYYLSNASFLKMDYLQLAYYYGRILDNYDLRLNLSVQNVFTITKYKGVEPEIANGKEGNFYPNPRTISVGLNLTF